MLTMKDFIKVMKALSDPNRVKIIKLLQNKTMCVCELQKTLDIAQSTVSKHLKILEEAGLISYKKDKLWIDYYIANQDANSWAFIILENMKNQLNNDIEIIKLTQKAYKCDRKKICKK